MTSAWRNLGPRQRQAAARMFEALDTVDTIRESVASAASRRIGFGDLYAFASDPDRPMSSELVEALRADRRLEEDLVRLLDRTAVYRFPRAAAASSGPVARRDGELFRIALRPSRAEPSQVYIVIELVDLDAAPPQLIYVCRRGRPCEKHRLPVAHDGAIQILADANSPLVQALRDGGAEVFLR